MTEKNRQVNECLLEIQRTRHAAPVERLYHLMGPTIRHIGMKYLHDWEQAEDFVQDFWADIYSISDKYIFCFHGFSYLCRVATNRAINRYRKVKREEAYVSYVDYASYVTAGNSEDACWATRIAVEAAMTELSDQERMIIQSTYFEQKTIRQIAAELHLSKSKVGRLKVQALLKLKQALT